MPRPGIYVPLSVDYADDPKIIEAGEKAELLYVRALCLMKRTLSDGHISDSQLRRFGLSGVGSRAQVLVQVGLWERTENGYFCGAFLKWNKSRDEVESLSQKRSQAARARTPRQQDDEQVADTLHTRDRDRDRDKRESEARKRATPPPDDFEITPRMRDWALEHAPGVDVQRETFAWIDWCRANGRTYRDHEAGWRTWMRRATPRDAVRPPESRPVLGRGVDAAPVWELDETGNAVKAS